MHSLSRYPNVSTIPVKIFHPLSMNYQYCESLLIVHYSLLMKKPNIFLETVLLYSHYFYLSSMFCGGRYSILFTECSRVIVCWSSQDSIPKDVTWDTVSHLQLFTCPFPFDRHTNGTSASFTFHLFLNCSIFFSYPYENPHIPLAKIFHDCQWESTVPFRT